MKISEIMTKKVIGVSKDTKVMEVAQIMTKNDIHGIPIIENDNVLVGIVTMSDFFIRGYPDLYLPSYIDFIKKTKFSSSATIDKKMKSNKLTNAKAKDIMSPNCVTIQEDEDVAVLLNKYQTSSLKTIPVVDKVGKLVGIVSRSDIIKLINI